MSYQSKPSPPLTNGQKAWGVVLLAILAAFYTFCEPFEPVYPSHTIREEYDFVIVGGGTAGSVLAHRLAEVANTSILVIEAGRPDYDHSIRIPVASVNLLDPDKNLVWNYKTLPQQHSAQGFINNRMTLPLGRVLGGSSSIGDMIYGRGNVEDFSGWGSEWTWDSLLPYFMQGERAVDIASSQFHGTEGELPVSRGDENCPLSSAFSAAAHELGLKQVDYTSRDQVGVSQNLFMMDKGERWSAARAFLEPAVNRRYKVHITTNSVASKILFSGNRATQVVYNEDGVNKAVRARKEIILTGGAIETPKLLMLSGIGPEEELKKHKIQTVSTLPVGKGLKDPLKVWMRYKTEDKVSVTMDKVTSARSFLEYYFKKSGPWSETLQSQTTVFVDTEKGGKKPNINVNMLRAVALPNQAEILGIKYELEDLFNAGLYDSNTEGFTFIPTLLHPESTGEVRLRGVGIHDPPIVDPQYLSSEADLRNLLSGVRYVQKLVGTKAMAALVGEEVPLPGPQSKADTDDAWIQTIKQFAFTAGHPSGTCAIGKVVTDDLKVIGVEGLRVVDSSIFPNTISGDYTGVLVAIAERIAQKIMIV